MKKIALLIFFQASLILNAQPVFKITANAGLGSYAMKDFKLLKDFFESRWLSQGLIVNNDFPVYGYFSGEVSMRMIKEMHAGFTYGFQSTGYSSSISDYSSEIALRTSFMVNIIGVVTENRVWHNEHFTLRVKTRTQYGWTDIEYYETAVVGGPYDYIADRTFKSNSLMLTPNVSMSHALFENFSIAAELGYCFDLKGEVNPADNGTKIYSSYNTVARTDWSGIRFGSSISYLFNK